MLLGLLGLLSKLRCSSRILFQISSPQSSTDCVGEDKKQVHKWNHFEKSGGKAETAAISTNAILREDTLTKYILPDSAQCGSLSVFGSTLLTESIVDAP